LIEIRITKSFKQSMSSPKSQDFLLKEPGEFDHFVFGVLEFEFRQIFEEHKLKTVDELRKRSDLLTPEERKGLRYVDDFSEPISTENVQLISALIESIASQVKDFKVFVSLTGEARLGLQTSTHLEYIMTVPGLPKAKIKQAGEAMIAAMQASGHIVDEISRGPGNFHCAWTLEQEDQSSSKPKSESVNSPKKESVPASPPKQPSPAKKPVQKPARTFSFAIPTLSEIEKNDQPVEEVVESAPASVPKSSSSSSSSSSRPALSKSMFGSSKQEEETRPSRKCFHLVLK
jgi:hypothetical protein